MDGAASMRGPSLLLASNIPAGGSRTFNTSDICGNSAQPQTQARL